jgi:hypothetical protein
MDQVPRTWNSRESARTYASESLLPSREVGFSPLQRVLGNQDEARTSFVTFVQGLSGSTLVMGVRPAQRQASWSAGTPARKETPSGLAATGDSWRTEIRRATAI